MWDSKTYNGTSWSVGDLNNSVGGYTVVEAYCSAGVGSFGAASRLSELGSATADLKAERALVSR
jgi:hypothetical protein